MLEVLVAATTKRNLPYPKSSTEMYEIPTSLNTQARLLCHTKKLKFLDKAAIQEDKESLAEKQSPWRLATITKVEELKLIINLIPIWLACLPFGICASQTATFFIKQGTVLNHEIGNNFVLPPASIFSLSAIGMIVTVTVYDRILMPIVRRVTSNERGITVLQRIGLGMIFSIASMVVEALVEGKRLKLVTNNPQKSSLSMSVFWLAPQFVLVGVADGFTLVGLQECFYDQVPDSMRSLEISLYLSVIGAANFLSSLLITIISRVTANIEKSWFGNDLDSSHLDKFYWLLAAIAMVNLFIYVPLARGYTYKTVLKRAHVQATINNFECTTLV